MQDRTHVLICAWVRPRCGLRQNAYLRFVFRDTDCPRPCDFAMTFVNVAGETIRLFDMLLPHAYSYVGACQYVCTHP